MTTIDRSLLEQIETIGAIVELDDRFAVQVTGADAERYLNGQVTNDVSLATPEKAIYACVTNAKGQLESDAWISRTLDGNGFLVDAHSSVADILPSRLERYAIADDVEFQTLNPRPRLHRIDPTGTASEQGVKAMRFGIGGIDLDPGTPIADSLPSIDLATAQALGVLCEVPRWGAELIAGLLPPEARIEERAISYEKGCYIGQEVISRIRRAGRTNRLLCTLHGEVGAISGDVADLVGAELFDPEEMTGKSVGQITSAAIDPRLDHLVALAYVKVRYLSAGEKLLQTAESTAGFSRTSLRIHSPAH